MRDLEADGGLAVIVATSDILSLPAWPWCCGDDVGLLVAVAR
jgi:hypothetical protein